MGKTCNQDVAGDFVVGLSTVVGLLAVIYGFYLMSLNTVDWGIFLIVIGFVVLLFLATVFLRPKN
jgi:hypothetical protein